MEIDNSFYNFAEKILERRMNASGSLALSRKLDKLDILPQAGLLRKRALH